MARTCPKIGVERDRARAGGKRQIIVLSALAVDCRPMREEHAAAARAVRDDRQRLLSSETGPLIRMLDGLEASIARVPARRGTGIEDDSATEISIGVECRPGPRSIVPAVFTINCTGPKSLFRPSAVSAPPKVTWPVVPFTMKVGPAVTGGGRGFRR